MLSIFKNWRAFLPSRKIQLTGLGLIVLTIVVDSRAELDADFWEPNFSAVNRSVILGMPMSALNVSLPPQLCVRPNYVLRLQPEVLDPSGQRLNYSANQFLWRLTMSDGRWYQWDARVSNGFGPFRRGFEANSVYVTIPRDIGAFGRIQMVGPGAKATLIHLSVPSPQEPAPLGCYWGHAQLYVGTTGEIPLGGFNPHRTLRDCAGYCVVGAYCINQCPLGATCDQIGGGTPYWEVRACPAYRP